MRLYLSSYGLGNTPEHMLPLIKGDKRVGIIMNAQDAKLPERRQERLQQEISDLTNLGLVPQELDLRDYFGKPADLAGAVNNFDYIWVRGGNAFLLRRAYKQSGFDKLLIELLNNDAIAYGGFSAGICVLAPSLHGIELVDPTDELAEGYEPEVVWDGLSVVNYVPVPHYKSDHPESADIDVCVEYLETNKIPYRTLRDGEAIMVDGTKEELLV